MLIGVCVCVYCGTQLGGFEIGESSLETKTEPFWLKVMSMAIHNVDVLHLSPITQNRKSHYTLTAFITILLADKHLC